VNPLDAAVVAAFLAACVAVGRRAGARDESAAGEGWLLGNRRLPGGAVLVSLVATELSAATFLGVPHAAFVGDWFYLELGLGALVAKALLAWRLIPLYYRARVVTVYGALETHFGPTTRRAAALCFLGGRTLASGARLFIAALALSVVTGLPVEGAIVGTGVIALLYTGTGGIRAVVWTDVLQAAALALGLIVALALCWAQLDGGVGAWWDWAQAEGRTRVVHGPPWFAWGDARPLGTAFVGGFFLTLATHSTDHDMVQRLLTTASARASSRALWISGVVNLPVTLLFLVLGTALALFYLDPSSAGAGYELEDGRRVVALFALHELPPGIRGLVFAAIAAAALSSLDSALCAMASTWCVDLRDAPVTRRRLRRASWVCAAALVAAALFVARYAEATAAAGIPSLVELALSAMTVWYGGLLAVFAWGVFLGQDTPDRAGVEALILGALVGGALFLHPAVVGRSLLAWTWWIPTSSSVALGWLVLRRGLARRIPG